MWFWYYSIKNGLLSIKVDSQQEKFVYLKLMPEPITSVLTFPFTNFGTTI